MKLLMWIVAVSALWYPPRLTVTPPPDSTVSDEVEIRVTSSEPLKRVEFLLDGSVVATDTSTPYTWVWDTLSVNEGEHVLTVRAIDLNDRVASTDVRYIVDNGLARGGAFYKDSVREHLSAQRWEEAVRMARRAVRLLPNDAEAHHLLAQAWMGASQWTKALQSAEQAAKLAPSTETLTTLARAHLQVAFAQTVDEEKRFASLRSAVESALKAGELRLNGATGAQERASALARLGRLEEAADTYLRAGNTADNALASARCYLLAGRWQDAERACNLAERRGADKDLLGTYRALILALRGRLEEARNALDKLEPGEQAQSLVAMARAQVALREMKAPEALRLLVPLQTQRAPDDGALDTLLTAAFAETRDFPRAEEHFRNALLSNPLNWQALAQKGYESLAVGSLMNAARYFELASLIRPDDAWVLCGRSLCATDRRQAVEFARKAVQQAPSDPWALVVLSSAQWRAGMLDDAMRTIERARSMDRQNYDFGSPPDARRAGQIARILGRRVILPME